MTRSTDAQKAERLNAAHELLAGGRDLPDAAVMLARDFGLSRRQAYRYLEEAAAIGHPVPVSERSVPITLKIPGSVVRDASNRLGGCHARPRQRPVGHDPYPTSRTSARCDAALLQCC